MFTITTNLIDFSSTPLSTTYPNFLALTIDNAFTPSECASLITHANSHPSSWSAAGINLAENQAVCKNFRDSDRKLIDNETMTDMIWERVRPHLPEGLLEISAEGGWANVVGEKSFKANGKGEVVRWRADRLNPRLRFLRYTTGQFFKPHCDGLNDLAVEDGKKLKSFVTLHIYLNDGTTEEGLEGGATRFWNPRKTEWVDVEPKAGRVLVFQQRMLVHSGEEVVSGMKYTIRTELMYERVVEKS
ncbi:hypothetical protein EX30DRAFT_372598 [Ascodesmis nigricans]|uniref:Prolyl 4-hydroxylase alpha subunit domain-containing protein n=1 Tax=Ascodesmis nigricans TaxID=341454 RepID=A0A4S2MUC3_9PEZI|nr:hypothetical protein EX30DRAFT_372598 [Ascodesmis nigricans]